MITLPGFANAHSHAFHRALRGRTHADGGTFWTWRTLMYAVADRLDPDRYFALARATYAEMALAGWTGVAEFHYVHHRPGGRPYTNPNAMGEALAAAAAEAGIRLTLLDVCYLSGGLDADGHRPLDDHQLRFSDGDVEAWLSRATSRPDWGEHVRLGYAIHSVRAVPRPALGVIAQALAGTEAPIHVHLSEQPAENDACLAHYGLTPTGLLAEAGLVDRRLSAVHATHLSADDIAVLGAAGATAVFCPTTERDLADGVGPGRALADAGVRLALGTDQHAVIDPFEEMRGLELDERLVTGQRGRFAPAELLQAAVADGWHSLGWQAPPEDRVLVASSTPRTAGADPSQIMFAATAADVVEVVCNGGTVVADGEHRLGDVGALLDQAIGDLQ
ncbi:formimidoylglutamate deiminase [Naumannella halotolerans]|uniref:Formiminoglutamate deiminase n=1 Tax=Naumannella halotolerans TaxID=993414 RepID=A0A4R7J3I4_9ACTN|nr:formimidoylglutamate deiminase [Naumannella halotolerans]TDT30957.1 formiminoglutamate deiminase [Naumannella halotolerans]